MRRFLLSLVTGLLTAWLVLGVVSAHVDVDPSEVSPDSTQAFTVRVPNEGDQPTVQVRVEFPSGLTVSSFRPTPGWTYEIEKDAAGNTTGVTWSGGRIGPGEFQEFAFLAQTPKQPGTLAFRVYQTDQAGNTLEWVGQEGEPNPAAFVEVRAAGRSPSGGQASGDPLGALGSFPLNAFALLLAIVAIVLSGLSLYQSAPRKRP